MVSSNKNIVSTKISRIVLSVVGYVILIIALYVFLLDWYQDDVDQLRDLAHNYHLQTNTDSLSAVREINEVNLWVHDHLKSNNSAAERIFDTPQKTAYINMRIDPKGKIESFVYALGVIVKKIEDTHYQFNDIDFRAPTMLMHNTYIEMKKDLLRVDFEGRNLPRQINEIIFPMKAVMHQLQRLHNARYEEIIKSVVSVNKRQKVEILILTAFLLIAGVVGVFVLLSRMRKILNALQESEERFRILTTNIPGMSYRCLCDEHWTMEAVNPGVERLTGYPMSDFIGNKERTYASVIHPDDVQKVEDVVMKAVGDKKPFTIEYRIIKADGDVCHVFERGVGLFDAKGELLYLDGVILDNSDQVEAQRSVQRLAALVKHSSDFIGFSDLDGSPQFINEAGQKLVGMQSEEEIHQHKIIEFFPEEDRKQFVNEIIPQVMESGRWVGETNFINFQSGEVIPVWYDMFRIDDPDSSEPVLFAANTKDMRQSKKAEMALKESEKRLNLAQQLSNIGSWELDLLSGKLHWSDEIFRIFEIDSEKFDPSYEAFLDSIHPDDREMVNKAYNDSLQTKKPYEIVHRLQMKDGRIKYVRESCETYFSDDGKALRSIGSVHDITEHRKIEIELEEYRKRLEKLVESRTDNLKQSIKLLQDENEQRKIVEEKLISASSAKSEFLSRMSHELRTPLNAILGFGQLLKLDVDQFNQEHQGNIQEIMVAGYHLLNIINEVLDLTAIEKGKTEIVFEELSIEDVVGECVSLLDTQLATKQLSLENRVCEIKSKVNADSTRLKQVLLNLISNAVKYNNVNGCITLNYRIIENQRIRLSIADTGPGLSDSEIARLFVPFERLNVKDNIEGTGIGLVISKRLVELMGGTIGVESNKGEGCTFWIELGLAES